MTFALRSIPPISGLAVLLAAAAPGLRATAAEPQDAALAPVVQALVGSTALLSDDGEREAGRDEGRRSREWSRGGERSRGDTDAMMRDVMARLSRIEKMLAERGPTMGRAPGGPPPGGPERGDWRGRGRPEMSPEMRQQWEARMKEGREKMKAAREKWEQASPEEREKMKQEWQARMKEGREKMEAAREQWKNASEEERAEMKKRWEARMREGREKMAERRPEGGARPEMPEEVRRKMEEARRMVDVARKRAAEMEGRVKRLEAELERMRKRAKGPADEEF